jgi:Protein of unknown function (DUF1501)
MQRRISPRLTTRRELLGRTGMGLGAVAFSSLLGESSRAEDRPGSIAPLAPRAPHFAPKVKHVIHLFLNGGPSHVDTFDPKPALKKYEGKSIAGKDASEQLGTALASPFKFARHGQSGLELSEVFPHLAKCADDLCIIRSMYGNEPVHESSMMLMNCGEGRLIRPSVGSWVTYGLGTENQNLPGFVALCPEGKPLLGAQNWRSAFLPGAYQGTFLDTRSARVDRLIEHARSPQASSKEQRLQLDLLRDLDRHHQSTRPDDARLDAQLQTFELAYRMQMEASDAFDIRREPEPVRALYGDDVQGRQMLIARRLVERGVRYVQVFHGPGQPWDSHDNIEGEHRRLATECDRAIAGLLIDLKRRGLLDETLVICGGEFGRTPTIQLGLGEQASKGRDHNHEGFSCWLAGGGVKRGHVHGATDEFGRKAIEGRVHVNDLHATILHLLGFDHERLTYRYAGRDFRLTDVRGRVVREILA